MERREGGNWREEIYGFSLKQNSTRDLSFRGKTNIKDDTCALIICNPINYISLALTLGHFWTYFIYFQRCYFQISYSHQKYETFKKLFGQKNGQKIYSIVKWVFEFLIKNVCSTREMWSSWSYFDFTMTDFVLHTLDMLQQEVSLG